MSSHAVDAPAPSLSGGHLSSIRDSSCDSTIASEPRPSLPTPPRRSQHSATAPQPGPLPFSKARAFGLVATLTGASFLNTLSMQAVVIILPTIGDELGIPETRQQWIISSYSLAFGCFLLLWGRIADIYGKRRIFVWGSALVTVTMIVNPFLPNEIAFNLFRGLQGLGGAANVPTAIGILGVTFPPGKAKNYAFSAYSSGAPLGSIFGTLIAGFIASYANWKWVFGACAGLALLVTVAGLLVIPSPPPRATDKEDLSLLKSVDWAGGALITAATFALLFALTEGNVVGWATVWIYLLLVISLLLVGAFVGWQWYQEKHRSSAPLIRVSVFKNGLFSLAMLIMAMFFAAFNDFLIYATYLYQDYQGLSPIQTTLRFLPTGVVGLCVAFAVSHLISRVPTFVLLMMGNLAVALSSLLFALPIPDGTSYFAFGLPAMALSVVGADIAWPCLTLFTSKSLPAADQALGGALINSAGQIGRAIGLAISTAVQASVMASHRGVSVEQSGKIIAGEPASLAGLRSANWFNFGLAVTCTCIVGLFFRRTGIVGRVDKRPSQTGGEDGRVAGTEKVSMSQQQDQQQQPQRQQR